MSSIGQYRVDPVTLEDGQVEMPLLDEQGRLVTVSSGGGGGGGDVNVTGGTLDTLTTITDPITVTSITNPVDINPIAPGNGGSTLTTTMFHGSKTVPTGTAESLGVTTNGITGILVSSRSSNSAAIYLGGSSAVTTATGVELLPGASVKLSILNVNQCFCISGTAAQVLNFLVQ